MRITLNSVPIQPIAAGIVALGLIGGMLGQAPTGTISGIVTDPTGAVIPNASVTVSDKATGAQRELTTNPEGIYAAPVLPAGTYTLKAEAAGFRTLMRDVEVQAGVTVTAHMQMEVGQASEVVSVEAATSQLRYESHNIEGVITRRQIENLPLNGRSFLQLAFLEPGVSVGAQRLAQYNAQFSVGIAGGRENMTAITVDGGNIRNAIEGNTGMNFSQEVVQEFQISTANFDLSTGITGAGAVNIVTRSGGNDYHGVGYYYFRDHNMSAYPALQRNSFNPDPFFARRQTGFWLGGPIQKNKAFFFFNLEHNNQDSVVTIQPNSAPFASLAQNAGQPYTATQESIRFDYHITPNHMLFLRYSHDGNRGFGPLGSQLPSNWVKNTNWSDQSILGLTSTLKSNMVNDFRFAYQYWRNRNLFPDQNDCPGCIGLGLPQMMVNATNVQFGNTSNATQGRDLRKFTITEIMTWQKGSHRMKFGGEWEYAPGTGFWGFADPAAGVVYGPDFLRSILPPPIFASFNLPAEFRTTEDLLRLPLAAFVMGIGDPSQPPPFQVDQAKRNDRVRFFWQDSWRVTSKFTLNYGLAWNYESTLVNHDLDKPQYLAPVLGAGGIGKPKKDLNNYSPSLGFAWNIADKTVIRGGGGIYYNTRLLWQRLRERALLGPVGNGRVQVPGTAVLNPLTNVPGVPAGTPLDFSRGPSAFTLGHLVQALPTIRAAAEQSLVGRATQLQGFRGIEIAKAGDDLIPQDYPAPYSEHLNIGVQRELRRDLVMNADFVFRHTLKDEVGPLDYNRYQAVDSQGRTRRVIPACVGAQAQDPRAQCSTGAMTVWSPIARNRYAALLLKVDKRFGNRYMFTVSYALQDAKGLNTPLQNLDNWFSTFGPREARHTLNISGMVDLPKGFQVSFINSAGSRGPVMATIPSIDLDGDGSSAEPLPGARFNGFNRGLGKEDLTRLIDQFNQQWAGKTTVRGQTIPRLPQPSADYRFGEGFATQDIRVSKNFNFGERFKLSIFGEVFNLFNIANLGGFSYDLTNANFGKPTNRASQVFGSGGPRAFQVAARFSF